MISDHWVNPVGDLLIPQVRYQTNDAWELASAGRPLESGVSGYPMLLRTLYSKGSLYVITIPDDMGNLYDLPEGVLNIFRRVMSQDRLYISRHRRR